MVTPSDPKYPKRPAGKDLPGILNEPFVTKEGSGLSSLFQQSPGFPEGHIAPSSSVREGSVFDPIYGPPKPRKRVKPGLGPSGRERIRDELSRPPLESSPFVPSGEEPPDEPGDIDGGGRPSLPRPEYIKAIGQAERPPEMSPDEARFEVLRPDKDKRFYGQGAKGKSTRVQAMQWIPTSINEVGEITGDIFVAFARPSKGKSGLFLYKEKDYETWVDLRSSGSIGRSITALGSPVSQEDVSEDTYSDYRALHPYHSSWIFEDGGGWLTIRAGNSLSGDKPLRSRRSFEEALREDEALKARREELRRGKR